MFFFLLSFKIVSFFGSLITSIDIILRSRFESVPVSLYKPWLFFFYDMKSDYC